MELFEGLNCSNEDSGCSNRRRNPK